MKKRFTLLFPMLALAFTAGSQVIFTENFTSPFNPATAGWGVQNNSQPTSTLSWFQGNPNVFPAFNGTPPDYYGCNFNNTTGTGTISSWLITPTMTIYNGLTLEFATRSGNSSTATIFPDRLQVRMSDVPTPSTVPAGPTSLGTFTNLLLDINPNYSPANSSAVNNGSVNGYPFAWAVFSVNITGVTGTVTGRFAFRYFVENGGPNGSNSNFIGVDAVKLAGTCQQPSLQIATTATGVCSGGTVGLMAVPFGSVAVSSYTWSNGQNGNSTVVSPTANTVYTVSATSASGCVGTQTISIAAIATPTVSSPSHTICTGTSVTLTASGAASYSWSTGSTSSSIVVSPGSNTTYTVTGFANGGVCPSDQTVSVTVGNQLSLVINATATNICVGTTVTLTAVSAASQYSWSSGQTVPTITVAPASNTTYIAGGLAGVFPNICLGADTVTITVMPSPTLSILITPSAGVCSGGTISVNTSGANSYTYNIGGGPSSTVNPAVLTAPNTPSTTAVPFSVAGQGANGCVSTATSAANVFPNPTVTVNAPAATVCVNGNISLTASGANSYAWAGASTSSANPLVFNSGSTPGVAQFTVTGTSTDGCTDAETHSITVVACQSSTTGIAGISNAIEVNIFPNPFSNEIRISGFDGTVEMFNALGQVVISSYISDSQVINTANLPKGVYILKAVSANGANSRTSRIVKN